MAEVGITIGFTKNMGNYESLRISPSFSDTVREGESVEEAQRRVFEVVEKELISRLNEVVEELK